MPVAAWISTRCANLVGMLQSRAVAGASSRQRGGLESAYALDFARFLMFPNPIAGARIYGDLRAADGGS